MQIKVSFPLEISSPDLDQLIADVAILKTLAQLTLSKETSIMQEFDDLKAAMTTLNSNDATEQQTADAILTLLKTNPSGAEVAAITAQVQKVASNEAARAGALQAAIDAAKAPPASTTTTPVPTVTTPTPGATTPAPTSTTPAPDTTGMPPTGPGGPPPA